MITGVRTYGHDSIDSKKVSIFLFTILSTKLQYTLICVTPKSFISGNNKKKKGFIFILEYRIKNLTQSAPLCSDAPLL